MYNHLSGGEGGCVVISLATTLKMLLSPKLKKKQRTYILVYVCTNKCVFFSKF